MDQRACPERAGPFCVLKAAVCQTEITAWQQSALGRHMGAMAKGRETATHALVAWSLGLRLWDAEFCVLKAPSARPKAQPSSKAPWGGARALWQIGAQNCKACYMATSYWHALVPWSLGRCLWDPRSLGRCLWDPRSLGPLLRTREDTKGVQPCVPSMMHKGNVLKTLVQS